MKHIKNTKEALKITFESKQYIVIGVLFAFFILAFNVLINNYSILLSSFSFMLLFTLFWGTLTSMTATSLIFLIVMSILAGIVLAMTIFIIRRQVTAAVGASSTSIIMSVVAPACPSCAIGVLSTLGLGGFMAYLPFNGLELGVLGVIVLSASLVFLSGKIISNSCPIKGENTMKNEMEFKVTKDTLWKVATVILLILLISFGLKWGFPITSNAVKSADGNSVKSVDGIVEVTTTLKGFKYNPDVITVKEGETVKLTIVNKDDVSHGLHLMQFGVMESIPAGSTKKVEFVAKETPTNNEATPTCSEEHGETLTINVV